MFTASVPPRFTENQGQYLAFIYMYALVNGQAPAEADVDVGFSETNVASTGVADGPSIRSNCQPPCTVAT